MSDTGGTPAGWLHAAGDPEGTERYWDGTRWVGEPRVSSQIPTPPPAQFAAPVAGTASPSYGAPGAHVSATPPGYEAYTAVASGGAMTPAAYGQRVIAYLIDFGLYAIGIVAVMLVGFAGLAIADVLGVVVFVAGFIAVIAFMIWNLLIRQGRTGQSIGKQQQGIKLVKDDTRAPVGGGMVFVRYLVAGLLSNVTCGIFGILDILWPLWDHDSKRLTDKILNMSVVLA